MAAKVPKIVSSQDFTGQTSGFGPTTLFTPSVDGLFRLSAYVVNSGSSAASVDASFGWHDASASRTGGGSQSVAANQYTSIEIVAFVASGNAITISGANENPGQSVSYDVHVSIEEL